ncbi:hypothetical protein NKG94_24325 [Micromonospora sp. M12]
MLRAWYAPRRGQQVQLHRRGVGQPEGLRRHAREVWEALHSARRVIRHLGDDVMVVYAAARRGRRLAVLLAEADGTDNDWDILSARELSDVESKRYDEAVRRSRR